MVIKVKKIKEKLNILDNMLRMQNIILEDQLKQEESMVQYLESNWKSIKDINGYLRFLRSKRISTQTSNKMSLKSSKSRINSIQFEKSALTSNIGQIEAKTLDDSTDTPLVEKDKRIVSPLIFKKSNRASAIYIQPGYMNQDKNKLSQKSKSHQKLIERKKKVSNQSIEKLKKIAKNRGKNNWSINNLSLNMKNLLKDNIKNFSLENAKMKTEASPIIFERVKKRLKNRIIPENNFKKNEVEKSPQNLKSKSGYIIFKPKKKILFSRKNSPLLENNLNTTLKKFSNKKKESKNLRTKNKVTDLPKNPKRTKKLIDSLGKALVKNRSIEKKKKKTLVKKSSKKKKIQKNQDIFKVELLDQVSKIDSEIANIESPKKILTSKTPQNKRIGHKRLNTKYNRSKSLVNKGSDNSLEIEESDVLTIVDSSQIKEIAEINGNTFTWRKEDGKDRLGEILVVRNSVPISTGGKLELFEVDKERMFCDSHKE